MTFETFALDPRLLSAIREIGYTEPLPIQREAIPLALAGHDLIALAQTGTGKTAAFALPILQKLLTTPRGPIRALILAPTRELAEQIEEVFRALGRNTRVRSTTIYGGVNINPQLKVLKEGVEVVVACPGRLLDHLSHQTIDLSRVELLVLDEADRMLDMGFLPDVRRVLRLLPTARQTILCSATMPDEVLALTREFQRSPRTIRIGFQAPAESVAHILYPVPQHLKTSLLLALFEQLEAESVIIFTRTKHRARQLAVKLAKAGHSAVALQGNLSQNRRQAALDGFRSGEFRILVATDIASRGIDVAGVSHVINFDIPDTVDAYTHRIGRTGRVDRTGDAFTLVTPEDEPMVKAIEKVLGYRIERYILDQFDYAEAAPARPEDPRFEQLRGRSGRGPQGPRPRRVATGGRMRATG